MGLNAPLLTAVFRPHGHAMGTQFQRGTLGMPRSPARLARRAALGCAAMQHLRQHMYALACGSRPGSQHVNLTAWREGAEVVLDQPANCQQISQRPPRVNHVEVDVGAIDGDDAGDLVAV